MANEKPVVVYDGECPFCIEQIERFQRLDKHRHFEYIPRQEPGLEEKFPILTQGDFNSGMRLIRTDGTVDVGADAIYQIVRRLPGINLVAWLYCVPGITQIAREVYKWIAANRKKLGRTCDTGACKTAVVPSPLGEESIPECCDRS